MKKSFFGLVFTLLTFSTGFSSEESIYVDCFDYAVASLERYEEEVPWVSYDAEFINDYLNETYAACDCLLNDNCHLF